MSSGAAIVAGDVPPFTTLVLGPIVTLTSPRAKCAPSLSRITLPPRTVKTSPAREITTPITVSTPTPGTLVPPNTEGASNSRVAVADPVAAANGQDVARARDHHAHHGVDPDAGHAGAAEHGGRVEFARRRSQCAEGRCDRSSA